MREINIRCRHCKQRRASGIWQVVTMHFGNESQHLWPMCAACGFDAVNLRKPLLVNVGKRDEHYVMARYIVRCKLVKTLGTDAVKPVDAPDPQSTYSAAMHKYIARRKERLDARPRWTPKFITDDPQPPEGGK